MYDEDDVYMGEGFFPESKGARTIRVIVGIACAVGILSLGVISALIGISNYVRC